MQASTEDVKRKHEKNHQWQNLKNFNHINHINKAISTASKLTCQECTNSRENFKLSIRFYENQSEKTTGPMANTKSEQIFFSSVKKTKFKFLISWELSDKTTGSIANTETNSN